jgi:hypothetical protein
VRYMIPYVVLRREVMNGSSGITEEQLTLIVRRLLRAVEVDENWYKQEYPDVAQAIDNQNVRSAKHHFTADGYFEGRLPFPHEIDEEWYVKTYTDVAERFDRGEIPSIEQHYAMHGYRGGTISWKWLSSTFRIFVRPVVTRVPRTYRCIWSEVSVDQRA